MSTEYRTIPLENNGGSAAVLTLHAPPLNALSHPVRSSLVDGLNKAISDSSVRVIVITGAGANFSAGADITEMIDPTAKVGVNTEPTLVPVVNSIEASPKVVIAAIDGVALGGGCEVALACHYRVATKKAKLGLPEVKIGLIPGAGGTQRLPRLVPIASALHAITSGATIPASLALKEGLVDHIIPDSQTPIVTAALAWAQSKNIKAPRRTSELPICSTDEEVASAIAAASSKVGAPVNGREPVWSAIEAIKVAVSGKSFAEGMASEGQLFGRLIQSQQSRARRHLFFAERESGRPPRAPPLAKPISKCAVIGAGTMGSGIATVFLLGGLEVVLIDANAQALAKGAKETIGSVQRAGKRRKIPENVTQAIVGRLTTAPAISEALKDVDLVVEAVVERMEVKKIVFSALDKVCAPHAILCTNTSTLNVDDIASATNRPEQVMGMHFFSPAQAMPLVECVRGSASSLTTIAAVLALTKKLNKIGVLVGNCDGFVGNRMLKSYTDEVVYLLEEGASPRQIDRAVEAFGMPIGPLAMSDLAGNDISWLIRQARKQTDPKTRDANVRYCTLGDKLCEAGRFGQKVGKGWYRYEGTSRKALDDPFVDKLLKDHRSELGINARDISDEEIVGRCFLPLINEGFKILEEGIASSPADIDVVWAHGYSWPRWRGGPMFWADELGPSTLLSELERYKAQHPTVPHWAPSSLLTQIVHDRVGGVMEWHRRRKQQHSRARL